ncbi:MAG: type II secretion system F family protein [Gammaproteobacteria bacterium]|nr:type II secretion system F family protein [Gammaproteobacteria bacterium]
MPTFHFNAKSASGEHLKGTRQAASASAIAHELRASGMVPLGIQAAQEGGTKSLAITLLKIGKQKVQLNELVVFSHQMASLTKAGISVVRAVRTLGESSKNDYLAQVLVEVAQDLEAGADVATSLGRHPRVFNELYISLIHVGENTGRLDSAFNQISRDLELERETRRRVQAATRYPSFVLVAISIAVVILNIFVIPAFAQVFEKYNAELPWQTQAILAVSRAFVDYWPIIGLLLAAGIFAWRRFLQTTEGLHTWHSWKIRIPIVGSIFERIYLSRFCHTFAMVSRAGVPLVQGLKITSRAIGNEYMARKIVAMRTSIERGESITATAHKAELFSPVVLQMMSVGEETGTMDELLEQAALFYEEEVEYELKSLTDALEPILIVGISALVLIMALGVFLPLWDLNSVAH